MPGFFMPDMKKVMHSPLSRTAADQRLWRVPAACSLAWALFMLWGCLNETGVSGGLILRLFPFLNGMAYADKLVHASLHGVLATLLWWAAALRARSVGRAWTLVQAACVVGLCAVYGGLIEGLQSFLTVTRGAEWLDALANTLGAGLAVLFWQRLGSRWLYPPKM